MLMTGSATFDAERAFNLGVEALRQPDRQRKIS